MRIADIKRGELWEHRGRDGHIVRVMGVVDGYVVHRRPGAVPSLTFHKDFRNDYINRGKPLTTRQQYANRERHGHFGSGQS